MESNGDQAHYTKRVVLPSGKTIEVVYFKDAEAGQHESQAPEHPSAEP
jgi:hypothetical protein